MQPHVHFGAAFQFAGIAQFHGEVFALLKRAFHQVLQLLLKAMDTLLQTLIAFLLTGVLGGWITHNWQSRALKDSRYYEAQKSRHLLMIETAHETTELLSRRLYALQRIILNANDSNMLEDALKDHVQATKVWNEKLMSIEVSLKSYFRHVYSGELEDIQSELAALSRDVAHAINNNSLNVGSAWDRVVVVRRHCFGFLRGMIEEAKLLDREMHFGVRLTYSHEDIDSWSTKDLIKGLVTSRIEGQTIIRAPSDFGIPVDRWNARLGIDEH